ncbi:serine--tRNA synthetase-like protein Slimp [Megalopta genalis]|uniref:serine--tRNA synthetase-like protein Slimp n=1 Tax=Megalopta genalis TaxID=115081 RepID=UPI003FD00692
MLTMTNNIICIVRTRIVHNLLKHPVLKHVNASLNLNRHYSSALFISGKKAMEVFSYISPYLDFDDKLSDFDKFQKDLTSRGFKVNAKDIKDVWELFKSVNADKNVLQIKMDEVGQQLKNFTRADLTPEETIKAAELRQQFLALKQDLKAVRDIVWNLDETVIEKMLKLPNSIDERTPLQSPTIMKTFGELSKLSEVKHQKNHIDIGRNLGLLEYKNPMHYYLCNDAALFELGALSYAGKIFTENNMIRVTGSDFSRSLVVEGSGMNHEDPMDAFIIDNHCEVDKKSPNQMHLVGNASLASFLAMHAKQVLNPTYFPLKYFTTGRQYTPFPGTFAPIGLFTVCQASVAHAFVMVKDTNGSEYHEEFEQLLNTVSKLYDNICDHYQVVVRSAPELRPWELMRVSFELWSMYSKQYIEIGHISMCGKYFSKRLLIAQQTPSGRDFPSVISGTVMSVPRLLGCLLEQNPEKFVIPKKIAECMPIDHTLV